MSQDPFQALYSGIGGALLLHLTTIESIYPTVCAREEGERERESVWVRYSRCQKFCSGKCTHVAMTTYLHYLRWYRSSRPPIAPDRKSLIFKSDGGQKQHLYIPSLDPCSYDFFPSSPVLKGGRYSQVPHRFQTASFGEAAKSQAPPDAALHRQPA